MPAVTAKPQNHLDLIYGLLEMHTASNQLSPYDTLLSLSGLTSAAFEEAVQAWVMIGVMRLCWAQGERHIQLLARRNP